MAFVTADSHAGAGTGVFASLRRILADVAGSIEKMQQYKALAALSDSELASRGLKRETLARFVMLDSDWT